MNEPPSQFYSCRVQAENKGGPVGSLPEGTRKQGSHGKPHYSIFLLAAMTLIIILGCIFIKQAAENTRRFGHEGDS